MKLVRFRGGDGVRIGVLVGEDVIDLQALGCWHNDSMREFLDGGEALLAQVRDAIEDAPGDAVHPLSGVSLLAPIADPQKVICVGQNYRDHCLEQNQPLPKSAILFAKFPTAITDPGAPIVLPRISEKVDYEAELALVIGRRGRHITEEEAPAYVAGYMCLDDVSARDIQSADGQWVRAKSFDTFAPIGPCLVTTDEIPDPHVLDISLTLNGETMQRSNTSNLIFGVFNLVAYISQTLTLEPGDVITTGTPGGVGVFRDPQVFLKPGDTVSVTIQGIGTLTNPVVADRRSGRA